MKKNNISSAAIVMGDVNGILQMQAVNTETEDGCYSADQETINVRDEKHKHAHLGRTLYLSMIILLFTDS